jgi:hypothetical protein
VEPSTFGLHCFDPSGTGGMASRSIFSGREVTSAGMSHSAQWGEPALRMVIA